jgi:EpsI family protein
MKVKRWPFIVAVAMLAGTWGLLASLYHHEEVVVARKPLAQFPLVIGGQWKGTESSMDENSLNVLKLSDYILRYYVPKREISGSRKESADDLPVWLYVGFYQSQRTGATYHSPQNCLPGAGWQFMESKVIPVSVAAGTTMAVNQVLIQKGLDEQVIYYWYQDRGRVIASEYWAKVYLVLDAMTRNRTDGALVRISIPVYKSREQAIATGTRFLQAASPLLTEGYLPP